MISEGELVKSGLVIVLTVGLLFLARLLMRHSRDADSKFYLGDLLLGADGRASKAAMVLWGSFILSSWVIAYLTLRNRLTDVFFLSYLGAWVAPQLAGVLKGKTEPPKGEGE